MGIDFIPDIMVNTRKAVISQMSMVYPALMKSGQKIQNYTNNDGRGAPEIIWSPEIKFWKVDPENSNSATFFFFPPNEG